MEGGNFYRVGPGFRRGRITFLEDLKSRGRWKISPRRIAENNLVTARAPFTKKPNSGVTKNFPLPQINTYNSTKVTLVKFGNLNP